MNSETAHKILKDGLIWRPSPNNVPSVAGTFKYKSLPDGRIKFLDNWGNTNVTYLSTYDQLKDWPKFPSPTGLVQVKLVAIHRKLADILTATWFFVEQAGLQNKVREFNGVFMPRHMLWNVNNPLSIHTWAWAIDFEARFNGYSAKPTMNIDFVRVFESCGWTWGGRWRGAGGDNDYSRCDGMHFQYTDTFGGHLIPSWQDSFCK
jgi:D-alanyl-D-alanine carboxypeptidase